MLLRIVYKDSISFFRWLMIWWIMLEGTKMAKNNMGRLCYEVSNNWSTKNNFLHDDVEKKLQAKPCIRPWKKIIFCTKLLTMLLKRWLAIICTRIFFDLFHLWKTKKKTINSSVKKLHVILFVPPNVFFWIILCLLGNRLFTFRLE